MNTTLLKNMVHLHRQLQSIPGPNDFGSYLNFQRNMEHDALTYTGLLFQKYGDVMRLPFVAFPLIMVSNPDLVGKVLLGTEKTNKKSMAYERLHVLLGEGLITSNGDLWKRQRKLSNPAFHNKVIQTFFSMIVAETEKMCAEIDQQLAKDPVVDISEWMTRITFTVIAKALFSLDVGEKAHAVREALAVVQNYSNYLFYSIYPLPLSIPTPRNRAVNAALETMDKIVYQMIEEHRQHPERYHDLLSVYLSSRDEETGEAMSDKLLRDEVITLMLAGHDTTATSLSLCFEHLAKDSRIAEKLFQEVAHVRFVAPEQVMGLPYAHQVFSETMRLYPAAWSIGRQLTEELRWESYVFPKGTSLMLTQYHTHRHAKHWDRPDEFRPERFMPDEERKRHPFAYFPFGGGQRTCIGSNLARLEAQVILPMLWQRYEMSVVPGHSYRLRPLISMVVDPGVKLQLKLRSGSPSLKKSV